jgi:succinate dehydrogenase/fumarate reductase flavoprotein subunit
MEAVFLTFILMLAIFLGFELINKVPATLHTPLMSGANAISGITVVGAIGLAGTGQQDLSNWLGAAAVALASINVFGGYMVTDRMLAIKGNKSVDEFHRELGTIMWDKCGMERTAEGLTEALERIPQIREEFWSNVKVVGSNDQFNQELENAGRLADFFEFAEILTKDALNREESCGGHFRTEHQTDDGEAMRNDEDFCYVAAWEFKGAGVEPELHKEPLKFDNVKLAVRSYK